MKFKCKLFRTAIEPEIIYQSKRWAIEKHSRKAQGGKNVKMDEF